MEYSSLQWFSSVPQFLPARHPQYRSCCLHRFPAYPATAERFVSALRQRTLLPVHSLPPDHKSSPAASKHTGKIPVAPYTEEPNEAVSYRHLSSSSRDNRTADILLPDVSSQKSSSAHNSESSS